MINCTNQFCKSVVTDIYTDGGWKRICPVCGAVTALHEQHITPDQADATAGSAYNKATDGQYGEAERLFWEAYCASTDEGRKSGYLWWAVKCCFGIEYVKETLYENDPQRRQDTYVPIFARFPLNADILGPSKPETLRGFEGYLQGQPHAGLKSLYTEMRALYMETVNAMQNEAREKEAMEKWETDEDSSEAVKDKPEQKEDESPYQTGFQSGGYTYYVQEDGSACITNYKGLGYVLNLPKELNGHAVKRIGRGAFANRSMVSITLPDTLTAIGDGAFERCSSLGSIKLPDGMTAIGDRAFSGCHSLRSIQLPAGIKAIGDEAFDRCSSLDNVELPDTLIAIGDRAFGGCRSLQSMTIPKGVNEIGYSAFKNCDALTLNVKRGSYAQGYAEKKGIPYVLG